MKLLKPIIKYCDDHEIKMIESAWLLYCHVLGTIGLIWWAFIESEIRFKYLIVYIF